MKKIDKNGIILINVKIVFPIIKIMKKARILLAILITLGLTQPAFCEETDTIPAAEDDMFAPIELDLTDYTHLNKPNKRFKLSAEKEGKPTTTKAEGQIWDEDMLFRYNYYSDDTNLRVLPSYGSLGAFVTRDLDDKTTVTIGQDALDSINGDKINFAYDNYSYYAVGAKLEHQGEKVNYAVASYGETDTLNQQVNAIITTKPRSILNSKGKFYAGTGVFTTLMSDMEFTTTGAFVQYNRDKLSIGAQLSNSAYSKSGYGDYSKAHLITKYKLNEHWTFKNRIVNNFDKNEVQGELGIVLNPLKDTDRLELEVAAANYQSQNVVTRQRLKFTTSFKF